MGEGVVTQFGILKVNESTRGGAGTESVRTNLVSAAAKSEILKTICLGQGIHVGG